MFSPTQVPGQPAPLKTDGTPAQSPQNVRSKMMLFGPKCDAMLHDVVFGNSAIGVPQFAVLMDEAPFFTSEGTLPSLRGQKKTWMYPFVRSIAYHPPPFELKEGPKEFALFVETPQPVFPLSFT